MPAIAVSDSVSTQIVAADHKRVLLVISNSHATSKLHINFAAAATTGEAYIPAGGNMTLAETHCKCAINGLSSSGTISANYSTFSAFT